MQGRMADPLELGDAGEEQRLEVGLDVEEIDVAIGLAPLLGLHGARRQRGNAHRLVVAVDRLAGGVVGKAAADLEDPHAVGLALAVGDHVGHQATDQRGAHHAHLAGDGVGEAHRVGVAGEVLLPGLLDEGEVDDFLVLAGGHLAAQRHRVALRLGARQHRDRATGGADRDVVVAVDAGDLFDQVFLDLHVEAVGRRRDDEVVAVAADLQVEALEHARHRVGAEVDAEHPAHAAGAQADRGAGRQLVGRDGLDHRAGFAAADVEDQARGALHGLGGQREINAALEAVGGIRREAVGTSAAGNGVGREKGALEEEFGGVEGDAALLAAHDAGQRQGAGFVGDQEGVSGRRDGLAIEEQHLLASLGQTHVDGAGELRVVEGVQRLAEFEHHVVGDVHEGADRTDAAAQQALLHPLGGRRLGVDAADDAAAVTRAGFRRVEHDHPRVAMAGGHRLAGRQAERAAGEGGHLAGDAAEAQAVGAVGRQLDGEQGVVEGQVIAQIGADRRVLGQHQEAAALVGDAEFLGRAQHAEGLDAAQLGRLDAEAGQVGAHQRAGDLDAGGGVGGAADDLQQLALPRVDLADAQLVGVGMLLGFDDLRDDDLGEHGGHAVLLFHFQPRHGEQMPKLVRIEARTDETAQPEF